MIHLSSVIPAKAGIHLPHRAARTTVGSWTPAFAGMTFAVLGADA